VSGEVVPLRGQSAGESGTVAFEARTDQRLAQGFTQIPNIVLRDRRLTAGEKVVYGLLLSFAWGKEHAFPSHATLAACLGASVDTVQRDLQALAQKGFVRWERRGRTVPNVYTILAVRADDAADASSDAASMRPRDTAWVRLRDTAPMRHKEDSVEEDSGNKTQPSAPSSRRRGSSMPSSPAVSSRKRRGRERKPTSVSLRLKDPEAHRVAKAIYDARLAAGHAEVSAPKSRFMARYAGAVYDLMHAPHPVAADEIMAAVQDAIERGRRYLGPPALADIVTEHRQSQMTTRRNRTHGSSHRAGADPGNDYNGIAFDPGAI
jgi:hypothetical protein